MLDESSGGKFRLSRCRVQMCCSTGSVYRWLNILIREKNVKRKSQKYFLISVTYMFMSFSFYMKKRPLLSRFHKGFLKMVDLYALSNDRKIFVVKGILRFALRGQNSPGGRSTPTSERDR